MSCYIAVGACVAGSAIWFVYGGAVSNVAVIAWSLVSIFLRYISDLIDARSCGVVACGRRKKFFSTLPDWPYGAVEGEVAVALFILVCEISLADFPGKCFKNVLQNIRRRLLRN